MNKLTNKILLWIITVFCVIGSFFLGFFSRWWFLPKDLKESYTFLEKYKKYYYFDDGNLLDDLEKALLDEYSCYYDKDEYAEIKRTAKGSMAGVGISVYNDSLKIFRIVGNSPCERAGMTDGGTLVSGRKNGGEILNFVNHEDFTTFVDNANENDELTITVDYSGTEKSFTVKKEHYTRTFVKYYDNTGLYSFTGKDKIELNKISNGTPVYLDNVGYIVYENFDGTLKGTSGSAGQFEEVLKKFKNENKDSVIIDLRNNGGGYMDILTKVVSHFIDANDIRNPVISKAIDKNGKIEYFKSKTVDYNDYNFKNIIILCNRNTASASEAFIGAVLDYDKKGIVKVLVSPSNVNGETEYRTYGKGIMQTTYTNGDGSAVKLTTAKIYFPLSNISIHGVGITEETSNKVFSESGNSLEKALQIIENN